MIVDYKDIDLTGLSVAAAMALVRADFDATIAREMTFLAIRLGFGDADLVALDLEIERARLEIWRDQSLAELETALERAGKSLH